MRLRSRRREPQKTLSELIDNLKFWREKLSSPLAGGMKLAATQRNIHNADRTGRGMVDVKNHVVCG
jgi:hypothetical protein